MGGWFVDVWIEWIVRMVARDVQRVRSRSWPVITAIVTGANCERASYGCHLADIFYDYSASGGEFSGIHEEPFVMHSAGEEFARAFREGMEIQVRVNPSDSEKSLALIG